MEERIRIMLPLLDERQRRIFLAAEAKTYGRGGISTVSRLSGVAPYTIRQGLKEIVHWSTKIGHLNCIF